MTIAKKLRQFAVAALVLATPAAHAALPYADGDLILGFRASGGTGGTSSYEVNIGQASQFVGASSFTVTSAGAIAADLAATFGADWNTRADVFWSISGVQFTAAGTFTNRTIFASKAEAAAGAQSTPWVRVSTATQNPVALRVQSLGNSYANGTLAVSPGQIESTNNPKALIQENGVANSYGSYMPGGSNSSVGSAYAFFTNAALGIENTFETGAQNSVIDLYQVAPGSVGTASTFMGAFRLDNSGVLTFSPNPSDFGSGPAPASVALSAATYSVNEDAGSLTVSLARTVNTTSAFSVNLSTTNGTAFSGTDYTAQTNVAVSFAAGDTVKNVDIPILDRAGFQGSRAFSVDIALGSGTANVIAPTSATVTIAETDPQPATLTLSAATYTAAENAGNATITVSRTGGTVGAVSVSFATTNDTALSGTDYTTTSTAVDFADGETSKTVNVPVADRAGFQGSRAFSVTISAPTGGAVLGTQTSAAVTITDDEVAPVIAIAQATYSVSETAGTLAIDVTRTGSTDAASSATISTSGGTAVAGRDYTTLNTAVNFAGGETTKTVSITILDAVGFQGSRTFNAQLTAPTLATLGTAAAVVTITDNDNQPGNAVAGSYSGLITPSVTNTLNNTGAIALKITALSKFTGKVFIGGTALSISGTFGANGVATFKSGNTTEPLALKAKPAPIPLGNLALTIFGDSIVGTLTNGAAVADVVAERAVPYDGKTPATTVPATILDAVTKGYHTAVIPSKTQGTLAASAYPQGDGVGAFTVSKKGAFKLAGTLADGTKYSAAGALDKTNNAPLFAQLYKKKTGLLSMRTKFDATRADSDALSQNLLWICPADTAAKQYPAGFTATLDLLAARYRAPQKGDLTSAFPGLGADDLTAGNATLTAADGKLTAPVVNNANISAKNKVTNAPSTDKDFKLTFDAKKGALGGNFTHTDTTKPKFTGVVYQKGPTRGGYGYFLSTFKKGQPTAESGGITLLAK